MIKNCHLTIRNSAQVVALLLLTLSVGGCATRMPDMGVRSDGSFEVPAYVRNLPKSRTGNMEQYTVFGKQYRVMDSAANFSETGKASWYGKKFHGRKTSSGEIYDMYAMTAAHKHLPIPTYVRVTNLENNKVIVVKVNDRGPFIGTRIIDLSYAAAQALDMAEQGVANVRVDGLSTHLVAESNDSAAPPPVVVTPELAAVPLSAPVQITQQALLDDELVPVPPTLAAVQISLEPDTDQLQPSEELVAIETSEDGFVELTNNYFIQLGAFSHAPNAQSLVEEVAEQMGLPAYVEQDAQRAMFRVKMGPFKQGVLLENTLIELANVGIEGYTVQPTSR